MDIALIAVAVVAFGLVWLVLRRSNELFCISVRAGRLLVVRGAVPGPLLHDIADVVRRDRVENASIRGVRADGHARIVASGVADTTAQRLRNVFGSHPIQKLRAAPTPRARNLGQVLGISWLAWLLLGGRGPDA